VWADEQPRGIFWLRPSRLGRWVWRLCRLLRASSGVLLCRVGLLQVLLTGSGLTTDFPALQHLVWVPVADWGVRLGGWLWPHWLTHPWYRGLQTLTQALYRWCVLGVGLGLVQRWLRLGPAGLLLGRVVTCERDGSRVELERVEGAAGETTYRVRLCGEFVFVVTPRDSFQKRLILLWLRLLRTPGRETSPWGLVRQEVLGQVFGVKQEEISRWQQYWQEGRWAQLLSLQDKSLLTDELRQQIVAVWATNIWQTADQVWHRLTEQGVEVAQRRVEEAGRQSGLLHLRTALKAQLVNGTDGVRPREDYVVQQLFQVVEQLQQRLEQGQTAVPEQIMEVAALRQLTGCPEDGKQLEKPWPWLFQVEHFLFGDWQPVEDGTVRCIYCGSDHVAVKSKQPRRKAYLDEQGQRQTVEVYRYYCKNPNCGYRTFTNLPPGLIVHSVWTLDARLKGLELYCGLRTTYRGAAVALGVAPSTLYHWLALFGSEPLQVAAVFGLVRSSGVVGIDEKYVKVPKACGERSRTNDKPGGKHRQWMYVYVAVDAHTLDLLHMRVMPHLGKDSARLFLLELRAKGYHPRVVVTDLSQDYAEPLAEVFPKAVHHECVFHALQYWHRCFKDAFGRDYAETRPELFQLRQQLDQVFQAKTRRTVEKRYAAWREGRAAWVSAEPWLAPIFDSVERHYPLLVNAYGQPHIPLTNNATERLIRRFDQHYQNFAGFDSLETAQSYLHLFELTYRLTPFGAEVQPHLRGKCPLELAGYDVTRVSLARYLREHGTRPLIPAAAEVVPK
jgi:transposase-like protein